MGGTNAKRYMHSVEIKIEELKFILFSTAGLYQFLDVNLKFCSRF